MRFSASSRPDHSGDGLDDRPNDRGRGSRDGWRRGSVGSNEVWDEARRAAHRGEDVPSSDLAVSPGALSIDNLAEIISRAVGSTVDNLFPELPAEVRERLDNELRDRIADLLEGREEATAEAPATIVVEEEAPELPQNVPVPREEVDPILADRIRTDFERIGAGMHVMKVLRETAIATILDTLDVERRRRRSTASNASPGELAKIDLLERRIAKLTTSIAKTREALAEMAAMKDFDPGIPSIYRTVQGLTPADDLFRVKRELLSDIFDANVELQRQLRREPEPRNRVA